MYNISNINCIYISIKCLIYQTLTMYIISNINNV